MRFGVVIGIDIMQPRCESVWLFDTMGAAGSRVGEYNGVCWVEVGLFGFLFSVGVV